MDKKGLENGHRDFYREYYNQPHISTWRKIGAQDKAGNVISMWSKCGRSEQPSVADIGCGDGALIQDLDRRGFARDYTGLEISESGLEKARIRKYYRSCRFILFDGSTIPILDHSFDLAVLSHVLEHVDCPRILLLEAARIAGHVFVEVPLELNCRTAQHYKPTPVGHINLYNPLLLRQLVQSTGLIVLAEQITCPGLPVFTYQQPFWKGWLHWAAKAMLLRLSQSAAATLFTYHGCLLARR